MFVACWRSEITPAQGVLIFKKYHLAWFKFNQQSCWFLGSARWIQRKKDGTSPAEPDENCTCVCFPKTKSGKQHQTSQFYASSQVFLGLPVFQPKTAWKVHFSARIGISTSRLSRRMLADLMSRWKAFGDRIGEKGFFVIRYVSRWKDESQKFLYTLW